MFGKNEVRPGRKSTRTRNRRATGLDMKGKQGHEGKGGSVLAPGTERRKGETKKGAGDADQTSTSGGLVQT